MHMRLIRSHIDSKACRPIKSSFAFPTTPISAIS